jgi:hypothetical protein
MINFLLILIGSWLLLGLLFFISLPKTKTLPETKQVVIQQKTIVVPPSKQEEYEDEKDDEEEDDDNDVMSQVVFFEHPIVENKDFYRQLSTPLQKEFSTLFIEDHPNHLVKSLLYIVDGDNRIFFTTVFNHIYSYRRIISLALLKAIHIELIRLAEKQPNAQTLLNEAMIRVAYFRRKDDAFLQISMEVAQSDVALHQKVFNTKGRYVHSFVRLAIIYEKKKRFQDALSITTDALSRLLDDRTKGGYSQRKERLLQKIEKESAK